MRLLQTFITLHAVQYFAGVQGYLKTALHFLKHINKHYNPLLISAEKRCPPVQCPVNQCKTDIYLWKAFIILSVTFFAAVVIRCIWSYWTRKSKAPILLDTQVNANETCKKQDYEKLKIIYKILFELKHQLAVATEDREIRPTVGSEFKSKIKELPSRSLYTSVAKGRNYKQYYSNNENIANLKQNLQRVLLLLEEQIDGKSTMSNVAPECQNGGHFIKDSDDDGTFSAIESIAKEINTNSHTEQKYLEQSSEWMKSSGFNECFFTENKMDSKQIVTSEGHEQKFEKTCMTCFRTKQALFFLQQQIDCEAIMGTFAAEPKDDNYFYRKCSRENRTENYASGLDSVMDFAEESGDSQLRKKCSRVNVRENSALGLNLVANFGEESRDGKHCKKYSNENKIENSALGLLTASELAVEPTVDEFCRNHSQEKECSASGTNLYNSQSSLVQKKSKCICDSSANTKIKETEECLNFSANKNSISIEILFNRDVQLSKSVIE